MKLRWRNRWVDLWSAWWLTLVGLSALCFAVAIFCEDLATAPEPFRQINRMLRLERFSLGAENSIGSWWTSMLPFLAGLHALDGYVRERHRSPCTARAWLSLFLVLTALSLDELGSLHERVEEFVPPFGMKALLPFALVLGGVAIHALAVLSQSAHSRGAARLIAFAFLLLASVPAQEAMANGGRGWARAGIPWLALEEGTELVAMLLLILVTSRNSAGIFDRRRRESEPVFQALDLHSTPLVVATLLTTMALAYLTSLLPDDGRGLPASWLGATTFLVAGLVALRPLLTSAGAGRRRHVEIALAAVCMLMSAASVVFPEQPATKARILLWICAAIALLWLLRQPARSVRAHAPKIGALMTPAALAVVWPSVVGVTIACSLSGVVAYWNMRTDLPCKMSIPLGSEGRFA